MTCQTVVLLGVNTHPVLTLLHQRLLSRGRRRVFFMALDDYPHDPGFDLHISAQSAQGRFYLAPGDTLTFDDISGLAVDGLFVPGLRSELGKADREYMQAEAWAALIGLLYRLGERALVANHILARDTLQSRFSELCHLANHKLCVPHTLVSSIPEAAESFCKRHRDVLFRPINLKDRPVQAVTPKVLENLDMITGAPVHFEERLEGEVASVVRIGDTVELVTKSADGPSPEDQARAVAALADLEIHLGEVAFVKRPNGQWVVHSLVPFLSYGSAAHPHVLDQACAMLEQGLS